MLLRSVGLKSERSLAKIHAVLSLDCFHKQENLKVK